MATTAQLSLTKLVEGQASAEVTINDALNKLDATIQLSVKDRDLTAPPGSPAEGDRYIVAASATGDWSGQDKNVAVYLTGWTFITAKEGFRAWVDDENRFVTYDGSAWVIRTSSEIAADASGTQAGGTPITTEVVLLSTVGGTKPSEAHLSSDLVGERVEALPLPPLLEFGDLLPAGIRIVEDFTWDLLARDILDRHCRSDSDRVRRIVYRKHQREDGTFCADSPRAFRRGRAHSRIWVQQHAR